MIVIIQGNKGKKIGSSSIINTKRCRGAETQEIIYRDCANVLTHPCSCDSILYGHFAKPDYNWWLCIYSCKLVSIAWLGCSAIFRT